MTKRRITEQEREYYERRTQLVNACAPEYVADAPFLFSTRIQVTQALSRIELFRMAQNIPGAIVECGVYKGNSLMLYLQLSLALEPYAINRTIVGFDTFHGFASIDADADPSDVNGASFSDTSFDVLAKSIELNDVIRPVNRIPRCELVRGDIVDTVPNYVRTHPEMIVAMLILDTDLYAPTKVALEAFLPRMPKGAIVVLDEIAYRNFPGETQALREVINLNDIEIKRFPYDTSVGYFRI